MMIETACSKGLRSPSSSSSPPASSSSSSPPISSSSAAAAAGGFEKIAQLSCKSHPPAIHCNRLPPVEWEPPSPTSPPVCHQKMSNASDRLVLTQVLYSCSSGYIWSHPRTCILGEALLTAQLPERSISLARVCQPVTALAWLPILPAYDPVCCQLVGLPKSDGQEVGKICQYMTQFVAQSWLVCQVVTGKKWGRKIASRLRCTVCSNPLQYDFSG